MSKVCAFLQNFDGAQLTRQDFYNFTLAAAAADGATSVSMLNRITYAYIAPIIITIGVIGDVLTVATLTHPLLRRCSIIYTYLTLLAMTDLLTHFSVVPMILWLLDWRLCSPMSAFYYAHVGFPLANALMGASVWLVVFLTFSQYMAVCQPFYQGYLRKRRMCFLLFVLSYAFSFCIYAPWSAKKSVYTVPRGILKCSYVVCDRHKLEEWFWLYEWAREFLTRLLPFFLIAYFNVMILVTYRSTKLDRMRRLTQSRHKRGTSERSEQEEKRLFGLLFGIIIIFFLCTIPAAPLTIFVADRRSQNLTFQIFRAVTNLLEFTKFALNFYFYCLINPDIRKICFRIIQCRKLGRPARVKGQPVNPISIYTRSTKSTIRGANGGAGLGTTIPNTQLHSRRDSMRSRAGTRQLRRANTSEASRRGSMIARTAAGAISANLGSVDDSFLSLPPPKKRSASATFLSAEPFVPTLLMQQHSEATKCTSTPTSATAATSSRKGADNALVRPRNAMETDGSADEETASSTVRTSLLAFASASRQSSLGRSARYCTPADSKNNVDNPIVVLAHVDSIKRNSKSIMDLVRVGSNEPDERKRLKNAIIIDDAGDKDYPDEEDDDDFEDDDGGNNESAALLGRTKRRYNNKNRPDRPLVDFTLLDFDEADFAHSSVSAPDVMSANTAALSEIVQIASSNTAAAAAAISGGGGDDDDNDENEMAQFWLPAGDEKEKMRLFAKILAKAHKSIAIGSSPTLSPAAAVGGASHHKFATATTACQRQNVHGLTKLAARAQRRAYSFGHQLRGNIIAKSSEKHDDGGGASCNISLHDHRQRVSDGAISRATLQAACCEQEMSPRTGSGMSADFAALLSLVNHANTVNISRANSGHSGPPGGSDRLAASSPISKSAPYDYAIISSEDATALALIATKALRAIEARNSHAKRRNNSGGHFSSLFRRSAAHLRADHANTSSMNSLIVENAARRVTDRPSNVSLSSEDVRALALIAANALKKTGGNGGCEVQRRSMTWQHLTRIDARAAKVAGMDKDGIRGDMRTAAGNEHDATLRGFNSASLRSSIHALEKLDARENRNTFSSFTTTNTDINSSTLSPNYYMVPDEDDAATIWSSTTSVYLYTPSGSAPISPRLPRGETRHKCPSPLALNSSTASRSAESFSASVDVGGMETHRSSKYRKRPRYSRGNQLVMDDKTLSGKEVEKKNEKEQVQCRQEDYLGLNETTNSILSLRPAEKTIGFKGEEANSQILKNSLASMNPFVTNGGEESMADDAEKAQAAATTTAADRLLREDSRRRMENARRNFITSSPAHNAAIVVNSSVSAAATTSEPGTGVGALLNAHASAIDERFKTAAIVRRAQHS